MNQAPWNHAASPGAGISVRLTRQAPEPAVPQDGCRRSSRLRAWSVWIGLFLVSGLLESRAWAQASEAETKAGFLFALLRYAEWPAASLPQTNTPLVVTLVGNLQVAEYFQNEYGRRAVQGRPLVIRRLKSLATATNRTHVLFVGADKGPEFPAILSKLPPSGVLTVGETPDFIEQGGILGLVLMDKTVQVHVNLPAAESAGLKLSSGLLGSARRVKRK